MAANCNTEDSSALFGTCINNVLFEAKLCRPLRGLDGFSLLHSHSLRCGLEECRQLRWLKCSESALPSAIGHSFVQHSIAAQE
jgi:hypothetical protein